MKINDKLKDSLALGQNPIIITENTFKKLLENCFSILSGRDEIHSITALYNSKPDIVKEFYAALLSVSVEFARNNQSKEEISQFLTSGCKFSTQRADIYADQFEKNRQALEISLLNIGSHLPHVTDVKWKIDYIVKSSMVDESEGPLFRVSLIAEEFDEQTQQKKLKNVNFSCTSQELQDLVYKLKDAVRHCTYIHKIF
ncbi:hypothetical protein NQ317_002104 [Molorchus minor]|uniref:COMM domain-containing protein 3 n=1 Tax=Molorchus minor TaxID=1323400 RepID=A0ABQ9JUE7_9CUCU|nr:hypothetical protein NQ317_002104 [Molorchus minor]